MASDNISIDEYSQLMNEIKEKLKVSEENDKPKVNQDEEQVITNDEFELVVGSRANSKLLWVPSENCFYKQNSYSKTYNGKAYTCYNDECKARKVLNQQNQLITIAARHIRHPSMQPMYKELYYLNLMKNKCRTEPHSAKVAEIYNKVQAMYVFLKSKKFRKKNSIPNLKILNQYFNLTQ